MPAFLKEALYVYLSRNRAHIKDYLFPPQLSPHNCSSRPHISTDSIGWHMNTFRRRFGLLDTYYTCTDGKRLYRVSVHTIRHAFLSMIWEQQKDILLVAAIIGHKKIQTTFEYIISYEKWKKEKTLTEQVAVAYLN